MDRTVAAGFSPLLLAAALTLPATAGADVFDDVDAAAGYELVYTLHIPVAGGGGRGSCRPDRVLALELPARERRGGPRGALVAGGRADDALLRPRAARPSDRRSARRASPAACSSAPARRACAGGTSPPGRSSSSVGPPRAGGAPRRHPARVRSRGRAPALPRLRHARRGVRGRSPARPGGVGGPPALTRAPSPWASRSAHSTSTRSGSGMWRWLSKHVSTRSPADAR